MNYDLYVVTDDRLSNGKGHVDVARESYKGGADVVQLRVKDHNPKFLEWAVEIARISRTYGRLFIVNDDIEIALRSGADGVHVGQSDMGLSEVRKIVPEDFIVGVSVGNVEEALQAEMDGASYVALSPIFNTSSKSDAGCGHGLDTLSDIRKAVRIPVLAIGGINRENVADVIKAGADGVAVISAVVSQPDIAEATREMRSLITASKVRR